jgi:hypothetical protein
MLFDTKTSCHNGHERFMERSRTCIEVERSGLLNKKVSVRLVEIVYSKYFLYEFKSNSWSILFKLGER